MSNTKQKSDVQLAQESIDEYIASVAAGDIERYLDVWASDGKQMAPGAPARNGRDEIRDGNTPMFELFDVEMVSSPEIRVVGNIAYAHGNYQYTMTPKEGGETIRGEGKYLTILERQPEGPWKLAIDCFNDNAPPPSE